MNGGLWTAEEDAIVLAMMWESAKDTAARLPGRTLEAVVSRRKTLRREKATKRGPWDDAETARLQEMVADGKSARRIAEELGRTAESVRRRMHTVGIHYERAKTNEVEDPQSGWTEEQAARLEQMMREGRTLLEMTAELGMPCGKVHARVQWLRRRGISFKPTNVRAEQRGGYSICWDCKNARAHLCSWFRWYAPVEGWTAEKTVVNIDTESYRVDKCPNFERDEKRR